LNEFFNSCPSDTEDQDRRFDVIEYVPISFVVLGVESLPASSRTLKDDWILFLSLLIVHKTPERLPGFLKN
jgi:hypothetical protein